MNRRVFFRIATAFLGGTVIMTGFSQTSSKSSVPEINLFEAKTFRDSKGTILPYRIFVPSNYTDQKSYPLVLWLHGSAGRGTDNLKQITGGNTLGATIWTREEIQSDNPCIVVAPQCPDNATWDDIEGLSLENFLSGKLTPSQIANAFDTQKPSTYLFSSMELIESLMKTLSVDVDRIYVTGQSLGGGGTWALIAEFPDRFAAAIPISGGGAVPNASKLKNIAIWAFHGEKDPLVPAMLTRRMIGAIKQAGGNPKYTEISGAEHPIWEQVFSDPELPSWLFSQRRKVH
jgi:predicted peptidase